MRRVPVSKANRTIGAALPSSPRRVPVSKANRTSGAAEGGEAWSNGLVVRFALAQHTLQTHLTRYRSTIRVLYRGRSQNYPPIYSADTKMAFDILEPSAHYAGVNLMPNVQSNSIKLVGKWQRQPFVMFSLFK